VGVLLYCGRIYFSVGDFTLSWASCILLWAYLLHCGRFYLSMDIFLHLLWAYSIRVSVSTLSNAGCVFLLIGSGGTLVVRLLFYIFLLTVIWFIYFGGCRFPFLNGQIGLAANPPASIDSELLCREININIVIIECQVQCDDLLWNVNAKSNVTVKPLSYTSNRKYNVTKIYLLASSFNCAQPGRC